MNKANKKEKIIITDINNTPYVFTATCYNNTKEAFETLTNQTYQSNTPIITQLIKEKPHFTFFINHSINILINNMHQSGFDLRRLVAYNNAAYGQIIRIYKINDDKYPYFMMAFSIYGS